MAPTRFQLLFCIIAVLIGLLLLTQSITKPEAVLGGKLFSLEVVREDADLERGLSGHKPLLDNEGMLFVFKKPAKYGFWMKDMTFPIDMIWIDADFRITHIEKLVLPETYPTNFFPQSDSLYVLELAGGQSEFLKIKIGDSVKFNKKYF